MNPETATNFWNRFEEIRSLASEIIESLAHDDFQERHDRQYHNTVWSADRIMVVCDNIQSILKR